MWLVELMEGKKRYDLPIWLLVTQTVSCPVCHSLLHVCKRAPKRGPRSKAL